MLFLLHGFQYTAVTVASDVLLQPVDKARLKEKASVAQEFAQKLTKGSGLTKTTKFQKSGLRIKPLPTADETKRIAKIFASKFA